MEKTAKKAVTTKHVKVKAAVKAPGAIVDVSAPLPSPSTSEEVPRDISTMDHSSGSSGLPTLAGQK